MVSYLLCTLHSGNDLEDVRFGCRLLVGHRWHLSKVDGHRGSSAVESVAPYLLTVLLTVDLFDTEASWNFCISKPASIISIILDF